MKNVLVLKIKRKEYQVTTESIFMDNGSCVQLFTGQKSSWALSGDSVILTKKAEKEIKKYLITPIDHSLKLMCEVKLFKISTL